MTSLALADLLVPEPVIAVPAGFQSLAQPITTGLPATLSLSEGFQALLLLPTGLARQWTEADPGALVATSADEQQACDPSAAQPFAAADRAPLRLLVRRAGRTLGSVPLALGVVRRIADAGEAERGVALELAATAWTICAGTVRGAGNFGSSIQLAWRIADRGVDEFGPPVVSIRVQQRRPPELRIHSLVGRMTIDPRLLRLRKLRRTAL